MFVSCKINDDHHENFISTKPSIALVVLFIQVYLKMEHNRENKATEKYAKDFDLCLLGLTIVIGGQYFGIIFHYY